MPMLEHIRQLFSYDDWTNREVLNSLEALSAPPERSVKLLAHILSAEKIVARTPAHREADAPGLATLHPERLQVRNRSTSCKLEELFDFAQRGGPLRFANLQEHERRKLHQQEARHFAPCGHAFCLPSGPNCRGHASRRIQSRLHRFHSCRAARFCGIDILDADLTVSSELKDRIDQLVG